MSEKIAILGAGSMGTACACILARGGSHNVQLWARNATFARHIQETRENSRLLPGVRLPSSVNVTSNAEEALQAADYIVVCIPTKGLRSALQSLVSCIPESSLIVSAIKGIENETLIRPSQIVQELLGERPVVAFGGPCHAEEVARGKPASVVAACDDLASAEKVQILFSDDALRVYANNDLLGVELAGALKNVMAIAAGISDGLCYGDNARSALLTRGLAEMVRFGMRMGAQAETFFGLAGIGDLTATCCSQHSRNRRVGELLGQGQSLTEIEASMHAVAEGVATTRSIVDLAVQRKIDMPIAREVYAVLFQGKAPSEATEELMRRPLRTE
ncbi:MAG: NAD(P)-dependent glycerol-3-phosphate dehydrogenase [Planctomycetaceae bacterium]|nr:NAD(P)-dependent glycerol-3-phosphate dehydrogenase [Planctomycetaceae bacterium]